MAGGTKQRDFNGTILSQETYPKTQPVLVCPLFALLGGVATYTYSLRSSSSGVGLWKNSIQGIILSSEMWKLSCEGCEFLTASRLSSSSFGTSRKWTSLLAPRRFARIR